MHEKDLHIAGCYESKPNAAGKTQRLQIVSKSAVFLHTQSPHGRKKAWLPEDLAAWAQQRVISLHPICDLPNVAVPPMSQEGL